MDKKDRFPKSAEVDEFRQHILKTAEDLVVSKFPKRIVQLNKMLSAGKLTCDPSTVYQKINIPVPDVSAREPSTGTNQQSTTTTTAATTTATSTGSSTTAQSAAGPANGESGVSMSDNKKRVLNTTCKSVQLN